MIGTRTSNRLSGPPEELSGTLPHASQSHTPPKSSALDCRDLCSSKHPPRRFCVLLAAENASGLSRFYVQFSLSYVKTTSTRFQQRPQAPICIMSTSQQQQREQSPPAPQTHGDPDKPNSAHQRSRSKDANAGKGTSKTRVCRKCQQNLTGQFVRALGCTYHLDCFRCQACLPPYAIPSPLRIPPDLPNPNMLTEACCIGLWPDGCYQIFPCRRGKRHGPVSPL